MAGPDRGTYSLPEPEDQVLVVFEHGDVNRPLVIGGLWSKKQEPVEVNGSGKNNTKLIKSRAGHRIIFDDTEGAEKITIVDRTKKNKIVLDSANKIVKIESDGDIAIKSAGNVVIHGDAVKLGTSEKLTGTGRQVLCHATSTFGLKANGSIVVDGSSVTMNVSNSPAAQVSGSGVGFLGGATREPARKQLPKQQRGGGGGGAGPSCPTDFEVVPASLTLAVEESSVLRASDIQPAGRGAGTYTWRTTSTKLSLDGAAMSPQVVSGSTLTLRAGSEPATGELVEVTRTQPSCAPITRQVRISIVCERFRLAQPRIIATATDGYLRPTTTFTDPALLGGYPLSFGQDLSFFVGRSQPFGPSAGSSTSALETKMRALLSSFASNDSSGKARRLFNAFLTPQRAVSFWSDAALTAAAEAHANIQTFVDRALSAPTSPGGSTGRPRIHQALRAAGWDINAAVTPTDLGVPAFNIGNKVLSTGDFGNGLGVMINGIQHAIVVAKAYSYNACRREYTIRLEFVFYDVFGLDDDDLQEFGADGGFDSSAAEGITAWWQLQHQHGYAPLITRIAFERELTVPAR
jgi:hypothetical protein